jgi:hypothetical protein
MRSLVYEREGEVSEKKYVVPEGALQVAWEAAKHTTNVVVVDSRKVMLRKGGSGAV